MRNVLALRVLKLIQDTAKENAETKMLLIAFAIYNFFGVAVPLSMLTHNNYTSYRIHTVACIYSAIQFASNSQFETNPTNS